MEWTEVVSVREAAAGGSSPPDSDAAAAVGVLIDFDNLCPPSVPLNSSALEHALIACLQAALDAHGAAAFMRVRLYGGWMTAGILSRRGSDVAGVMPALDPFPLVLDKRQVVRGSFDLATSLLGDPLVFSDTYRRRGSIPRLRLSASPLPEGCANDEPHCPARILQKFTQATAKVCPVATCGVTASSAFIAHEQKMVDTMMSCDLLEMTADPEYKGVTLVTADTDFVPPLIHAARRSITSLHLITPIRGWSPENVTHLNARRVQITDMEPLGGH